MAPNADGSPTAEEQAAIEQQMRAPKQPVDQATADAFTARMNEMEANITAATARAEAAEAKQQEAEAKLLAIQSGAAPARGARQIPLWYRVTDDHATASGDLKGLLADLNEALKDIPGFKTLTLSDFLTLNSELLDAEAKARGFDRGARWSSTDENNNNVTTGYHLFAGSLLLAGARDTTPVKPSTPGAVNATVTTAKAGEYVPTREEYIKAGYTSEGYDRRYGKA